MTIFETIGMSWVIFTSALATVAIICLSYVGLKAVITKKGKSSDNVNVPVEVKEMFKTAR